MTIVRTPVLPSRPDLRSFVVASLAVISLLLGGLALHTATGDHGAHAPATSTAIAMHHGTETVTAPAAGVDAAGPAAVATAASDAADRGLGADLLAACALLLALAGSVALLLVARSRRHRLPGGRADSRLTRILRHRPHPLVVPALRPDLIVLSISRR